MLNIVNINSILYNFIIFYFIMKSKNPTLNDLEKEIMTVKQVAKYLQMDEHSIYKIACSGKTPSVKIELKVNLKL